MPVPAPGRRPSATGTSSALEAGEALEAHRNRTHMPRAIWKGAISFGLVNIPVSLYSGSTESTLDLDMIDKRDFAPVGYRRVNKRTGEELKAADIVKGYEYAKGRYV